MNQRQGRKIKITDQTDETLLRQQASEDAFDEEPTDPSSCEEVKLTENQQPETDQPVLTFDQLQNCLKTAQEKADEEHNLYMRALADFQNYKRRQEERESSIQKFAARELILKILSVMDDFERAITSTQESQSFEALQDGLELTVKKLQALLESEGVKPIDAKGQPFDPMYHEAVMRVEDSEHPADTVVSELQRGYTLGSEVIRPSMVTVAVDK